MRSPPVPGGLSASGRVRVRKFFPGTYPETGRDAGPWSSVPVAYSLKLSLMNAMTTTMSRAVFTMRFAMAIFVAAVIFFTADLRIGQAMHQCQHWCMRAQEV